MNKIAFREVVFTEFPREGMSTLAFITNETTDKSGQKIYTIYIPTPPTLTTGFFAMIPEDKITHTDISIQEGIKIIISCGMILPSEGAIIHMSGRVPKYIADALPSAQKPGS